MSSLDSLNRRLERAASLARSDNDQGDWWPDLAEAKRSLEQKLSIWTDSSLTKEQKHQACQALDQEREATKSPEQRVREKRFWRRYPVSGMREQLIAKLNAMIEVP